MLEQIGLSVQSRGEELGIPYIPASLDARTPPKENLVKFKFPADLLLVVFSDTFLIS